MSKWQTKDDKLINDFDINENRNKTQRHGSFLMDEIQVET